ALGLGLALVAALAVVGTAAAQGGPSRVIVAQVAEREIADTAPIIARLVGTRQAEVATRAAGLVEAVHFEAGDALAAGAPMLRLDDQLARIEQTNAAAALAAAEAAVAVAEARARQTQQALDRAEALRNSTAFSRGAYEDLQQAAVEARAEITRAEAEVGVARAALQRAEYDVTNSVVYAPFDGVVVERMAQPGQYITLGEALASLLDLSSLEIEADVPVDLVASLEPGRRIGAVFDGGHATEAEVRVLLPVETTSTRTRVVRLAVVGALPRPVAATGRSVTLRVPVSAPRSAPVVPKDALVQGRGGWSVFVADSGNAEPRTVSLGQSAGEFIEVRDGVAVGEHVVIRGNERLRPGQPVAPVLVDGTPVPTGEAPEAEPASEDEAVSAGPEQGAADEAAGTETAETRTAETRTAETRTEARTAAAVGPVQPAAAVPSGSAGAATLPSAAAAGTGTDGTGTDGDAGSVSGSEPLAGAAPAAGAAPLEGAEPRAAVEPAPLAAAPPQARPTAGRGASDR
ncbi:MAG: efflux RND transporter periplasmic adaptor subunit, partial [Pseudomonadota bacterium]